MDKVKESDFSQFEMAEYLSELWLTLKLAVPMMISALGNVLMGLVDTLVVGRYSSEALAGVAAGNAVFWPIAVIGYALLGGMDPLVAESVGRRDLKTGDKVLGHGLFLIMGLSVVFVPLLYIMANYYYLTGAKTNIVENAVPFIKSMTLSIPFMLFFNVMQRYWQAQQKVMVVTLIILAANVVNYYGCIAFVTGQYGFPAFGAVGVGYATLAARVFTALLLLIFSCYYWRKRSDFRLRKIFKYDRSMMHQMFRIGVPAAGQSACEMFAFSLATTLIAGLGTLELAAHQVVLSLVSFTFMFPLGLASAGAVRVGILLGEKRREFAKYAGWMSIFIGAFMMAFFALILTFFPKSLIALFTSDQVVVGLAVTIIGIAAMFQVFDGTQVLTAGVLRGAGDTKRAFISNVLGYYAIGMPIGIFLCYYSGLGIYGIWIGLAIGIICTALLNCFHWWKLNLLRLS